MMRDEACPLPQASATAAEATPIAPVGWLRRAIRHVSIAAGITSAALIMRMPGAVMPAEAATPVATKSKTTTGMKMKKRKSGGQEVGWATVGMCGGLTYWSMRVAKKEDDEEEKRIKEETEKMERMAKEFKDVDGEVTVDADLLASLKKRMNATASDGDDADRTLTVSYDTLLVIGIDTHVIVHRHNGRHKAEKAVAKLLTAPFADCGTPQLSETGSVVIVCPDAEYVLNRSGTGGEWRRSDGMAPGGGGGGGWGGRGRTRGRG